MTNVIKVSKDDLVKAVEFYSNTNQEPNWLELGGRNFRTFFNEEDISNFSNTFDSDSYRFWLDCSDKEDTNENYNEWLDITKSEIKILLRDELEDGTKVEYID